MKLTWLGQAGWLICTYSGMRIMIDPYLSDSLREKNGDAYSRNIEIRPDFLSLQLDAVVITHSHGDHFDHQTLQKLFAAQKKPITVFGPQSVWEQLRKDNRWHNELVLFQEGTEYALGDVLLRAVFAAHSDPFSIGIIIEADGKKIYHSGDTLYHKKLINDATLNPHVLLLSINGKGNNMNVADGARLAQVLNPRILVPMHWDMFDKMGCDPTPIIDFLSQSGVQVNILQAYEDLTI